MTALVNINKVWALYSIVIALMRHCSIITLIIIYYLSLLRPFQYNKQINCLGHWDKHIFIYKINLAKYVVVYTVLLHEYKVHYRNKIQGFSKKVESTADIMIFSSPQLFYNVPEMMSDKQQCGEIADKILQINKCMN